MSRKVKKNSFVEGAMVGYIAILLSKIMGALYSIPFYDIIGDKGGVIYSCSYTIYSLFLEISTSGIPIALSIVVSEFNAMGMIKSKERTYKLAFKLISCISLVCFLIMQIFSKKIGLYYLDGMTQGVTADEIAGGIRAISFCLLIVPFLSLRRGYLQGHKILTPPSTSQVVEQIVRIAVVLIGSYTIINILNKTISSGVNVALFGATVGAVAAFLYLIIKTRNSKDIFTTDADINEKQATDGYILKRVFYFCLTIVIISVAESVYQLIDLKMILYGLNKIGYSDIDAQEIASISTTWIPKICMIITALSMGITNSIAPHLAEKRTTGNMKEVNKTLNQAISGFMLIAIPLGFGLIILSKPVYYLFYSESVYGGNLLKISVLVNVIGCLATIVCLSMQSIGKGKTVCIYTIVGIIVNSVLDLPLIYWFNSLGDYAYLGASVSSVIGQTVTFSLLILSLKRQYSFSFRRVFESVGKIFSSAVVMIIALIFMIKLFPVTDNRGIMLVIQLAVYACVGGLVYGLTVYFNKGIELIVGKNSVETILRKVHLKR